MGTTGLKTGKTASALYPIWRKELGEATKREIVSLSLRNDPHGAYGVRLLNSRNWELSHGVRYGNFFW